MNFYYILISVSIFLTAATFASVRANNMPLRVGDRVPDFTLQGDQGRWRLSDCKGPVVLFFYPSDDTPGCTKEACSINSWQSEFLKQGITVAGVSYNSVASHKKFKEKHNLRYALLSDPDARIAKLFGADRWWPNLFPKRNTYIIDGNRILRHVLENVEPSTHGKEVLDLVKNL